MKIIFSRKGFDSEFGGGASPIIEDKLVSLPIPVLNEEEKGIDYSNLNFENKITYDKILADLFSKRKTKFKSCHLDPDLRKSIMNRENNWTGIFGQSRTALGHLENEKVGKGDIFLFFGTFRNTLNKNGQLIFDNDNEKHIIFGYLLIGEKYLFSDIEKFKNENKQLKWAFYHPHFHNERNQNALFIADNKPTEISKGYGTFKYNDNLVLTKLGYKKSTWELPDIFYNAQISRHSKENFTKLNNNQIRFDTVGKGQEFVVSENKLIEEWAINLINNSEKYE